MYNAHTNVAVHRFGRAHDEIGKIKLIMTALLPSIETIVPQIRELKGRSHLSFKELAKYAGDKEDVYRTRFSRLRMPKLVISMPADWTVHFIKPNATSTGTTDDNE